MSPRSLTFNPDVSPIDALFARWVKLYVTQANIEDDDEAEPYQQPLIDVEKEMEAQPLVTMQDFFCHQVTTSCFGDFGDTISQERRQQIFALAMTEVNERENLLALIEQHKVAFNAAQTFHKDTGRETDGDPEFDALCEREFYLLNAVVAYPAAAISNIVLKGRYLAAVQAVGGLGYERAQLFVASLGVN